MYKNPLLLLSLIVVAAASCKPSTNNSNPCVPKICTEEFASAVVKFIDKNGTPVVVQNFTAINTRTGLSVKHAGPNSTTQASGYYTVANDNDLKELSDSGDNVLVSGTNPANGQTKTATFKLSGGCACHIQKVSGPAEIAFD